MTVQSSVPDRSHTSGALASSALLITSWRQWGRHPSLPFRTYSSQLKPRHLQPARSFVPSAALGPWISPARWHLARRRAHLPVSGVIAHNFRYGTQGPEGSRTHTRCIGYAIQYLFCSAELS